MIRNPFAPYGGNYPAMTTSQWENAPFNQVDPDDIYGADADAFIDDEVRHLDCHFSEWVFNRTEQEIADLCQRFHCAEDMLDETLSHQPEYVKAYHDFRFDDVVAYLAETFSEPDYEDDL